MSESKPMKGKVRWIGNPLADVVRCFRKLYPHCSADISVQPVPRELKGQCSFGDESHPVPLVAIDPSISYAGCIDVLAHELAHVAAGANAGHGPEWEKAYEAIHDEYLAFVERVAKRAGVEPVSIAVAELCGCIEKGDCGCHLCYTGPVTQISGSAREEGRSDE